MQQGILPKRRKHQQQRMQLRQIKRTNFKFEPQHQ